MTAEAPATGLVPRGCFNLHYEAWAHPYNWTDDNDVAAQGLARTVSRAVADTQPKHRNRRQLSGRVATASQCKAQIGERVHRLAACHQHAG